MAVVSAACGASPEPSYYALAPRPFTHAASPARPRVIELHHIGLAGYLDRADIVARVADYKLHTHAGDRWSAPLDEMVGRVLAMDMMARIPNSTVFVEGGAVSGTPDQMIEVNLQRFDAGDGGDVTLIAQVGVHAASGNNAMKNIVLHAHPDGSGTEQLVATMSDLLASLADQIITVIDTPVTTAASN
jgi:uncharacterized lipoprotein YmbA